MESESKGRIWILRKWKGKCGCEVTWPRPFPFKNFWPIWRTSSQAQKKKSQFTHEHFFNLRGRNRIDPPPNFPSPPNPLHFIEIPRKIHGIKGLFFSAFFSLVFSLFLLKFAHCPRVLFALFPGCRGFPAFRDGLFPLMCQSHFISNCCWGKGGGGGGKWGRRWRLEKLTMPPTPMAQLLWLLGTAALAQRLPLINKKL